MKKRTFLFLLLLCLQGSSVLGEINMNPFGGKKKDKEFATPPPLPVSLTLEVQAGEAIRVPLSIHGWRGRRIRYLIRSAPTLGTLTPVTEEKEGVAYVIYQHRRTAGYHTDTLDRFTFAAQDAVGPMSAPGVITLKIKDVPPTLYAPKEVNLGGIVVNTTGTKTFSVSNGGGGVIEGPLSLPAPWKISPTHLRLGRGEEATLQVSVTPTEEISYSAHLHLPGDGKEVVILKASGADSLAVTPTALSLDASRKGTFSVKSGHDAPQTIQISADPRLGLPSEITLAPFETLELTPALAASDLAGIETEVTLKSPLKSEVLSIRSNATPARLEASIDKAHFESVPTGEISKQQFKLYNRGGTPVSVTTDVPPPFQIEPVHATLKAAPGGEPVEFTLSIDPTRGGKFTGTVAFRTASGELLLPVSARVIPKENAQAKPSNRAPRGNAVTSLSGGAKIEYLPLNNDPSEQDPKADRTMPRVEKLVCDDYKKGTLKLSWAPASEPPTFRGATQKSPWTAAEIAKLRYRLEGKRTKVSPEGMQVEWVPLPGIKIEEEKGRFVTTLEKIPAGTGATLRVVTLAEDGRYSLPSPGLSLSFPASRTMVTPRNVLLLFLLLVIAVAVALRQRQMRAES